MKIITTSPLVKVQSASQPAALCATSERRLCNCGLRLLRMICTDPPRAIGALRIGHVAVVSLAQALNVERLDNQLRNIISLTFSNDIAVLPSRNIEP